MWPRLVAHAERRGVSIAIENCPMLFSNDEWPGGTNLATTPAIWDEMFSLIPSQAFGLNLDPSHLVWQMIDYERAVRDFGSRILHVHAKDLEIDREGLQRNGVLSAGMGWQMPRLPGPRGGSLGPVHRGALSSRVRRCDLDRARGRATSRRPRPLVKRGFLISRDVLAALPALTPGEMVGTAVESTGGLRA